MKILFLSWLSIVCTSILLWFFTYGFDNTIKHVTPLMKVSGAIFIAAVIINFIAEFGWLGGKRINKSSMYEGP